MDLNQLLGQESVNKETVLTHIREKHAEYAKLVDEGKFHWWSLEEAKSLFDYHTTGATPVVGDEKVQARIITEVLGMLVGAILNAVVENNALSADQVKEYFKAGHDYGKHNANELNCKGTGKSTLEVCLTGK